MEDENRRDEFEYRDARTALLFVESGKPLQRNKPFIREYNMVVFSRRERKGTGVIGTVCFRGLAIHKSVRIRPISPFVCVFASTDLAVVLLRCLHSPGAAPLC